MAGGMVGDCGKLLCVLVLGLRLVQCDSLSLDFSGLLFGASALWKIHWMVGQQLAKQWVVRTLSAQKSVGD